MSWDRWITIIVLVGGVVINMALAVDAWVHRRSDADDRAKARLDLLEKAHDVIRAKASDEASKWQKFIGDITIRVALLEERIRMREEWRRPPTKEGNQW